MVHYVIQESRRAKDRNQLESAEPPVVRYVKTKITQLDNKSRITNIVNKWKNIQLWIRYNDEPFLGIRQEYGTKIIIDECRQYIANNEYSKEIEEYTIMDQIQC